ncbi:SDR family NAD(P)-dependent oxidoreductase [Gordonia sp. TBRC 11910]|uniref:SDR family NAD(P)-dependent oxidoreductase n=1 Tax=Gordonia asplenii TaxID=2725283 RepID=A0A848KVX3_9ACTN|nr:SDR family NAD(P)-dependent oxidoreductase [Gordonia asplenii]
MTAAGLQRSYTLGDLTDLVGARSLDGRRVLITGASSGVGEATAHAFAAAGAHVTLIARTAETLSAVTDEIREFGGTADYFTGDLATEDGVGELVAAIRSAGVPDVVVNNAGRSIRRRVLDSTDRLHDFQRTMAINYFGPVGLTLGLLPAMVERGHGQFINVATWGVASGAMPKFAAYAASKAALATFGRSLAAELDGTGVAISTIYFPLIRTPMIAPTADYDSQPALSSDEAAEWILHAARHRPLEVLPRYAKVLRSITAFSASTSDGLVAKSFI